MSTIIDYVNELERQKNVLADTLAEKGLQATRDETFNTLIPKIENIGGSGMEITGTATIESNGITSIGSVLIHDNMKQFIRTTITHAAICRFINYTGSFVSFSDYSYPGDDTFRQLSGIRTEYKSPVENSIGMIVGSGAISSGADYKIGNIITTVSNNSNSIINNRNSVRHKASAFNTSAEDITITEIGTFFNGASSGSFDTVYAFMAYYCHFNTPLIVKSGDIFYVKVDLTYDIFKNLKWDW